MGLLTAGVLGFQALIVISMLVAASNSRTALNLVAWLWVLFTLFGSIFTVGLLLLQFLTIALGYKWSSNFVPVTSPQNALTLSKLAWRTWDFIRVTIIICVVVGWLASEFFR